VRNSSFLEVARMFCGLKQALSISTSTVAGLISLFWPPMTPARASGLVSSAMSSICSLSVCCLPSSVMNFARRRRGGRQWRATRRPRGEEPEIKGVQRLADFEHDEIGDIHDVVDAAQAGFFQEGAHPVRAGADFDAAHQAGVVARAQFGSSMRTA
jgi:hypothetical protein